VCPQKYVIFLNLNFLFAFASFRQPETSRYLPQTFEKINFNFIGNYMDANELNAPVLTLNKKPPFQAA